MNKLLFTSVFALLIFSCQSSEKSSDTTDNTPLNVNTVLTSKDGLELERLSLPSGFQIEVFGRVENARQIIQGDKGTFFVSNRSGGSVYALRDINGDFKADEIYKLATGLTMPNGVAYKDGALYVAEVSKLWRYDNIEENLSNPPKPKLIYDDYPTDRHHGWKYIAFGPDGKLYIPVGAPCNICESKDERYASITRMDPDGTNREVFVHGVRNTVGFSWHPETGEMWFTDNGRDMLGDDIPPCELNRVSEKGQHFGYPYCHGGTIKDPEFGDKFPCEDFVAPAQQLGPHVAPLGLRFYTGDMFPANFKNQIFIAEHGSWNRSPESGHTGHRITTVKEVNGTGTTYEVFMEGFLNKETNQAWGRPVDVLVLSDGSMLVTDDLSGTIYRITYKG